MTIASPSAEYRSEDDRLAVWRRAALERQRRFAEIASVPAPGYHERNLAAERGALVTVDSFLGSLNTDRDDDAYAPPGQVSAGGFAFRLERSPHPVLEELRERFGLEEISGHGSDLERAIRVRSWIKSLWAHGQPWRFPPYDGLLILDRASRGVESFICMHYSVALVHACLSLGIQARLINLHRGIADESAHAIGLEASVEPPIDEHVTAEIWSRELEKWVMVDPDFDCSYERNGAPQSAWDLHDALVTRSKSEISVLKGPGAAAYDVLGPDFYVDTMLDYYAHVSILMRNNFLSDPDGPIPALHLTDTATPRILWHRGEDMRLRPDLLGPMVVATPFSQ
ncbi:MAG: transglutaminase domain-containing protein, partial [Chloroflexi bacterium]|nr:transglutaminase domain-containing protein [Chloroflexota bacterium]